MRTLPHPSRRSLPIGLAAACVPLLLAWGTTISVNCPLGDAAPYCQLLGVNRTFGLSTLALPAGIGGLVLGWLLPDRWIDAGIDRFGLTWLFEPADRTLVVLLALVIAAAALAPFLFFGAVTHRVEIWLLLAIPYVPGLALWTLFIGASIALGPLTGAFRAFLLAGIALSFAVAAVAQTAWFYLIAGGIDRLAVALHDRLTG